jgi:signal transduction histidine kinase
MTINQDQQQLIIKISDEGIGIPPEEIDKIFDSFYRSKNTGTIEGTGLGLAIVKRAIDLHNGVITVSSELNKGTTFNVKIPLIVA